MGAGRGSRILGLFQPQSVLSRAPNHCQMNAQYAPPRIRQGGKKIGIEKRKLIHDRHRLFDARVRPRSGLAWLNPWSRSVESNGKVKYLMSVSGSSRK